MTVREIIRRILAGVNDLDAQVFVRIVHRDEDNAVQSYQLVPIERLHHFNELVIDQRTISYAPELRA